MAEDLGTLVAKLAADVADLKKGLREGRQDFTSFRGMIESGAAKIKEVLLFAGVTVGLGTILYKLKELGRETALVGARNETLQISAEKIGQTYGMSAESIKYYVEQAKSAGITTQESLIAVSKFLTSGLPLEGLKDLATRARDIAVIAGTNTSEAFNRIIQGIITGEQETLRRMMIQVGSTEEIYTRYAATLGKTKEQLNSVEKAQAMFNEVMRLSAGFAGTAAEADKTVGKQLASMTRYAEEAKNALWAFFGPVMQAAVQEMTGGWKSLQAWAEANREKLEAWGEAIAEFIKHKTILIRKIIEFGNQSKATIKILMEFLIIRTIAGHLIALGSAAITAGAGLRALATGATTLNLALGGPLATVIKLLAALAALGAYKFMKNPVTTGPDGSRYIDWGGHGFTWLPDAEPTPGSEAEGHVGIEAPESPAERQARAIREGKKALEKALKDAPKSTGKKGGKGAADNLLAPTLAMYKAEREVKIQEAQNYLDWLKTAHEQERAEQERQLAAGLIDGRTYYAKLQELQREETTAALAMIEEKRQAQQQAYQESLAELEADEKLSPEAKAIARRKLAAEQKKALAKLDTEAAKVELEDQKKITNELRRQIEVRKEYGRKTEDLNLETAQLLGAISEQEAILQRLYLDWQRAKEEAFRAGAPEEYFRALEANYQAKVLDASPWGQKIRDTSQVFFSACEDLANTLWEGGVKISQVLDTFGKKLLQDTFRLFFNDLAKAINQGIKSLISQIQNEIQSSGGGWFGSFFSGIGNWFTGLFGGSGVELPVSPGIVEAHGGVYHQGIRLALARGGVLTRPTAFALADGGVAVAGEAGYEGFLPLSRIGGDLGVKALFPQPGPAQVTVINNTGTEATATASQGDDGELLITLDRVMAEQAARGSKLTQVLEARYKLNRRF